MTGAPDITVGAAAESETLVEAAPHPTAGSGATQAERRNPPTGNSLWWPDRHAQVVQATKVEPGRVGQHVSDRVGLVHNQLRIDSTARTARGQFEADGQLYLGLARWREVTLRIYPTPSANLTVIEMLPRRAWMPQTARYLAAGVPAVAELIRQIEAADL